MMSVVAFWLAFVKTETVFAELSYRKATTRESASSPGMWAGERMGSPRDITP